MQVRTPSLTRARWRIVRNDGSPDPVSWPSAGAFLRPAHILGDTSTISTYAAAIAGSP
ncbi:MAG: hypothetical protein ACJAVS_001527 [Paracoccaceae bacterium]|jgi:hypothetical protein